MATLTTTAPDIDQVSARPGPEPLRVAPEPLGVAQVALAVRDLGRVEAFYRGVLGLAVIARSPGRVRLGAGDAVLLDLLHRPDALPDDPAGAGLFHTAFLLPSRAHLGRWLAHLAALGHRLDGAADHLVSEAAYLSDPEGNGVEICADRPRARWRWTGAAPRQIEMANEPLDLPGLLREATTPWAGAPDGTRVGHVHLRVGDAAAAARFYGGALGMDVTAASPAAAFLSTGGYHHHLAVNAWRSAGAAARDPRRAGLATVTFEAASGGVLADIAGRAGVASLGGGLRDPWGTALRFRPAPPLS